MQPHLTKILKLPIGVRVDGTTATAAVSVPFDADICPACDGHGEIECWDGNPSHRDVTVRCDDCHGNGIIGLEDE